MREMNYDIQPTEAAALISRAVTLDKEIKERKKTLDEVKAKLQSLAIEEMENKNIRYVRYDSIAGCCETSYKTKCEIDNYSRLLAALTGSCMVEDKIVRKTEIKYDIEKRFREALIAYVKHDYRQHDLEKLLENMGIGVEERKVVLKRLKGEYVKDRQLLESFGCTGNMEEELDCIREEKNRQLVERYFDPDLIDRGEIEKAVYLEDTISFTLTGRKDKEGEDAI